jgi:tetratricopeptide (TPR) repeat protein
LARSALEVEDLLTALALSDSALSRFRVSGDRAAVGRIEQLKGECFSRLGDFTQASVHLESALTIATHLHDQQLMATARRTLGSMHYFQRQFSKAWEHYYESLALARATGNAIIQQHVSSCRRG